MSGMVRVNIEAQAWGDLRFAKLARYLKLADSDHALIKCARLWSWQTDNFCPTAPTYVVDADTIDAAFGLLESAPAMVKATLADEVPEGFRIRGSVGRIEWLWKRRTARNGNGQHKDGSRDRSHDTPRDTSHDGSSLFSTLSSSLSSDQVDLDQPRSACNKNGPVDESPGVTLGEFKAKVDDRAEKARKAAERLAARTAKIPQEAWDSADRLRQLILEESPTNSIVTKPWDRPTGLRLEWADSMRLLVEKDRRTWESVAEMMDWLFHRQQPGRHKYIVQSPGTLREKWDRIVENRKNHGAARPQPGGGALAAALRMSGRPNER